MASRFDTNLASDWDRRFSEFKETIIRRIGGQADQTENVSAVVDRDHQAVSRTAAGYGRVRDDDGEMLVEPIAIELAANQAITQWDSWVVDGKVYKAIGEAIGRDGGSQTIVCQETKHIRARGARKVNDRR
ncbi:MAG: hypothetical protein AB7G28_20670 [Pirellulales bacterium]